MMAVLMAASAHFRHECPSWPHHHTVSRLSSEAFWSRLPSSTDVITASEAMQLVAVTQVLTSCVMVCLVCMQAQPLLWAHAQGFQLLGVEMELPAHDRLALARRWAEATVPGAGVVTFLATRMRLASGHTASVFAAPVAYTPPERRAIRSAAARRRHVRSGTQMGWLSMQALRGTAVASIAMHAFFVCSSLRDATGALPTAALPGDQGAFRFGATTVKCMFPYPHQPPGQMLPLEAALSRCMHDNRLLERELLADQSEWQQDLSFWAEQIRPPPMQDIPIGLLDNLPTFQAKSLRSLPFSPIRPPSAIPWVPKAPKQPPAPAGVCFRRAADLMPPAEWRRVTRWLRQMGEDLVCIRDFGPACVRNRPGTFVMSRHALYPAARQHIWDFRKSPAECATPLDFDAPLDRSLNADFFKRRLANYPNQRILGFIVDGMRPLADVERQTVLAPHLLALANGYESVVKEMKRMASPELGWYTYHADFPFFPMYSLAQSAVPRALEQRWRRCEEGGAPRKECFDAEGLRALSINEASRVHHFPVHYAEDTRPEWLEYLRMRRLPATEAMHDEVAANRGTKWERSQLPTLTHVQRDLVVLRMAAFAMNEPVYVLGDDMKDFYNIMNHGSEVLHLMNTVFLDAGDLQEPGVHHVPGGTVAFIHEKRMGFGLHPNSMIGQDLSEALLFMLREDIDAVEDALLEADPRPSVQEWLRERRELETRVGGHQRRLYATHVYYDDNIIIVVGAPRAVRVLKKWKALVTEAGFIMAIPEKRSIGTWGLWIGALIFTTLGLMVIPRSKILRASQVLKEVLQGTVQFQQYRSLIGLLEHLRCIARLPRRFMHGLYKPHGAQGVGRIEGPNGLVQPSTLITTQVKRWLDVLGACGGCSVLAAVTRGELGTRVSATYFTASDAATEAPAGLGGYMHGFFWQMDLTTEHLQWLHITVLELLACGFNMIIMGKLLPMYTRLLQAVDATSAYYSLARESERSEVLAYAHYLLLENEDFKTTAYLTDLATAAGDMNLAGDCASRSRLKQLEALAAALRIRLVRLRPPSTCDHILRATLDFARAQGCPLGHARRPPQTPLDAKARRFLTLLEQYLTKAYRMRLDGDGPSTRSSTTIYDVLTSVMDYLLQARLEYIAMLSTILSAMHERGRLVYQYRLSRYAHDRANRHHGWVNDPNNAICPGVKLFMIRTGGRWYPQMSCRCTHIRMQVMQAMTEVAQLLDHARSINRGVLGPLATLMAVTRHDVGLSAQEILDMTAQLSDNQIRAELASMKVPLRPLASRSVLECMLCVMRSTRLSQQRQLIRLSLPRLGLPVRDWHEVLEHWDSDTEWTGDDADIAHRHNWFMRIAASALSHHERPRCECEPPCIECRAWCEGQGRAVEDRPCFEDHLTCGLLTKVPLNIDFEGTYRFLWFVTNMGEPVTRLPELKWPRWAIAILDADPRLARPIEAQPEYRLRRVREPSPPPPRGTHPPPPPPSPLAPVGPVPPEPPPSPPSEAAATATTWLQRVLTWIELGISAEFSMRVNGDGPTDDSSSSYNPTPPSSDYDASSEGDEPWEPRPAAFYREVFPSWLHSARRGSRTQPQLPYDVWRRVAYGEGWGTAHRLGSPFDWWWEGAPVLYNTCTWAEERQGQQPCWRSGLLINIHCDDNFGVHHFQIVDPDVGILVDDGEISQRQAEADVVRFRLRPWQEGTLPPYYRLLRARSPDQVLAVPPLLFPCSPYQPFQLPVSRHRVLLGVEKCLDVCPACVDHDGACDARAVRESVIQVMAELAEQRQRRYGELIQYLMHLKGYRGRVMLMYDVSHAKHQGACVLEDSMGETLEYDAICADIAVLHTRRRVRDMPRYFRHRFAPHEWHRQLVFPLLTCRCSRLRSQLLGLADVIRNLEKEVMRYYSQSLEPLVTAVRALSEAAYWSSAALHWNLAADNDQQQSNTGTPSKASILRRKRQLCLSLPRPMLVPEELQISDMTEDVDGARLRAIQIMAVSLDVALDDRALSQAHYGLFPHDMRFTDSYTFRLVVGGLSGAPRIPWLLSYAFTAPPISNALSLSRLMLNNAKFTRLQWHYNHDVGDLGAEDDANMAELLFARLLPAWPQRARLSVGHLDWRCVPPKGRLSFQIPPTQPPLPDPAYFEWFPAVPDPPPDPPPSPPHPWPLPSAPPADPPALPSPGAGRVPPWFGRLRSFLTWVELAITRAFRMRMDGDGPSGVPGRAEREGVVQVMALRAELACAEYAGQVRELMYLRYALGRKVKDLITSKHAHVGCCQDEERTQEAGALLTDVCPGMRFTVVHCKPADMPSVIRDRFSNAEQRVCRKFPALHCRCTALIADCKSLQQRIYARRHSLALFYHERLVPAILFCRVLTMCDTQGDWLQWHLPTHRPFTGGAHGLVPLGAVVTGARRTRALLSRLPTFVMAPSDADLVSPTMPDFDFARTRAIAILARDLGSEETGFLTFTDVYTRKLVVRAFTRAPPVPVGASYEGYDPLIFARFVLLANRVWPVALAPPPWPRRAKLLMDAVIEPRCQPPVASWLAVNVRQPLWETAYVTYFAHSGCFIPDLPAFDASGFRAVDGLRVMPLVVQPRAPATWLMAPEPPLSPPPLLHTPTSWPAPVNSSSPVIVLSGWGRAFLSWLELGLAKAFASEVHGDGPSQVMLHTLRVLTERAEVLQAEYAFMIRRLFYLSYMRGRLARAGHLSRRAHVRACKREITEDLTLPQDQVCPGLCVDRTWWIGDRGPGRVPWHNRRHMTAAQVAHGVYLPFVRCRCTSLMVQVNIVSGRIQKLVRAIRRLYEEQLAPILCLLQACYAPAWMHARTWLLSESRWELLQRAFPSPASAILADGQLPIDLLDTMGVRQMMIRIAAVMLENTDGTQHWYPLFTDMFTRDLIVYIHTVQPMLPPGRAYADLAPRYYCRMLHCGHMFNREKPPWPREAVHAIRFVHPLERPHEATVEFTLSLSVSVHPSMPHLGGVWGDLPLPAEWHARVYHPPLMPLPVARGEVALWEPPPDPPPSPPDVELAGRPRGWLQPRFFLTWIELHLARAFSMLENGDGPSRLSRALQGESGRVRSVSVQASSSSLAAALGAGKSHARNAALSSAVRKRPVAAPPTHMPASLVAGQVLAAPVVDRKPTASSPRWRDILRCNADMARHMAAPGASSTDVEAARLALNRASEMAECGAGERTLETDDRAYGLWDQFCAAYGWDTIISLAEASSSPAILSRRLSIFLLWVYPRIRGRGGRHDAKPRSVLNNYPGAIARVLQRDFKLPVPRAKTYEAEAKGLLRGYKKIYGSLALTVLRRQPMTRPLWSKVESLAPGMALPGRPAWMQGDAHLDETCRRLGRVLSSTAHRLGEIVAFTEREVTYLTRQHVSYRIQGRVITDPSRAELLSMRTGDLVFLTPCSSKPDPFGEEHCTFPSVLEYDGTELSAAGAIRAIELDAPCSGAARASRPLFADASGKPYTYGVLNAWLYKVMRALAGPGVASTISWHSFRIELACRLRAAKCPDEVIQLICRWKCRESLQKYAQVGCDENVEWIRRAHQTRFEAYRTNNLVRLDHTDELAELSDGLSRAPSRPVARASTAIPAQARLEVLWGDQWWPGTCLSRKHGFAADGSAAPLHCVRYDAQHGWPVTERWHSMDDEAWRLL